MHDHIVARLSSISHSKHFRETIVSALFQLEVVSVLHNRHGVEYKEMAVITPYSAQKSLIHQLKDEKSTVAKTKLGGSAAKLDIASGPPAKPADSKLNNELTVVSITESQGEPSLHLSCMT